MLLILLFSFQGQAKSEKTATYEFQQQNKSIRVVGVVREPNGQPAVSVTVKIKGTTQGTITDIDGNYIITAPADGTLEFSYIGSKTQEIAVNGKSTINVTLVESANVLEEVVISVGYGTQRKMSVIGAQSGITQISDLKQPVANLTNVIAGRISGVIGVQRSGDPGNDNADLWIRGISTFSNSSPLVLVDGVERSMSNIDPEDIESFQILKDASATAIYGVKGANGVIMITTKQGQKGKPRVRVEYNYGIKNFTKVPEIADGVTYMQMANEASVTRGGMPVYSEEMIRKTYTQEDPLLYPNVKWMDELFQRFGNNQRVNINVNGGSEFAQYYVSVGYYDEQGLYKLTPTEGTNLVHDGSVNFKRYNFTTNLKMQVTKTTEVTLGVKGYSSTRTGPRYSGEEIFKMGLITYPTFYPAGYYDGDKVPWITNGGGMLHPASLLTQYGHRSEDKDQTYADIRIEQKLGFLLDGLTARGLFSFDNYGYYRVKRDRSPKTYYARNRDEAGNLILESTDNGGGTNYLGFERTNEGNRRYYMEGSLNYEHVFDGSHRVSGLFLYNQTDYLIKHAGDLISSQPYRSMGIAGRATYAYNDTYLAEANFGYNGSENFAPKKRFGFFPSIGLGWVVSNEAFFDTAKDYIQFLKIRATWGQAGNDKLGDNARRFAYFATVDSGVDSGTSGYSYGESSSANTISGYGIKDYAVDVTWETSTKQNLGVDLHTLKGDLVLQFDLFKDRRENIFLQRSGVPDYVGLRKQEWGNLGIIDNQGFEVSVDWNKKLGDWRIGLRGNYTFNNSTIIEDDSPTKPYPWMESRGLPRHHRFGFVFEGFYTNDEINTLLTEADGSRTLARPTDFDPAASNYLAGDLKYKDLNGDMVIDEYDMQSIGYDQVPQIVYGFGTTISYKSFSMGAFFQGVAQCDLSTLVGEFVPYVNGAAKGNVYADITKRWTPENQGVGAIYPRLNYGGVINQNYASSTFWLQDGSFIRLKTLDFGYTLPSKLTKKVGIENFRVYFMGNNLLTFTKFDRYDVELGSGSGTKYPNVRTYSVGFNFNF